MRSRGCQLGRRSILGLGFFPVLSASPALLGCSAVRPPIHVIAEKHHSCCVDSRHSQLRLQSGPQLFGLVDVPVQVADTDNLMMSKMLWHRRHPTRWHAKRLCVDVELGAEDATRADLPFLRALLRVAIDAGATCFNIPDTVGCCTPHEAAPQRGFISEG